MRFIPLLSILLLGGCFSPSGTATTQANPGSSETTSGPSSTGPSTGISIGPATGPTGPTTSSSTSSSWVPTTGAMTTSSSSGTSSTESTGASTGNLETTTMPGEAVCGDGVLGAGEACDDGNMDEIDGCSLGCERDALFVFVTSATQFPTFGSALDADALCTAAAKTSAVLPHGEYVAWVSDATSEIWDRIIPTDLPFIRTDLAVVLAGTSDLENAMLYNPIDHDEDGVPVGMPMGADCREDAMMVWTGTTSAGMPTLYTCENWTSQEASVSGHAGLTYKTTGAWAIACITPCDQAFRLYCFEQAS